MSDKIEYEPDANAAMAKEIMEWMDGNMRMAVKEACDSTQERPLDRVKVLVKMTVLAQLTRCVSNIAEQLANAGVKSLDEISDSARSSAASVCNLAAMRTRDRLRHEFNEIHEHAGQIGEEGSDSNKEMN